MVSLLLSFPIFRDGKILYLSVPLGYRLWDKEKPKLSLAAELTQQAMPLLPYSDVAFSEYQTASAQETRFEISQQIQTNIIMYSFGEVLETLKIVLP